MAKKQGFFSALREEVARGLSPGRSREKTSVRTHPPAEAVPSIHRRRRKDHARRTPPSRPPEVPVAVTFTSASFRETLAPLVEGPEGGGTGDAAGGPAKEGWNRWVRGQLSRAPSATSAIAASASSAFLRSDLRLLLGVLGAPLAPVHVSSADPLPHLCIKNSPIETSSAQYILQQYTAASGGRNLQSAIRNAYAMGKVRMVASEFETAAKVMKNGCVSSHTAESGGFVLWRMAPDMWNIELAVGGSKVQAGCNGKIVWRHTPWLGAHAAKGPVRPLRRALQGLDPLTTASMFANARCIGEKKVNGEDCFVLKLSADPQTLRARSEGPAEIIRHVLFGYFSQRTGLLVNIEDSHLTRIQPNAGSDAVYWETTIKSSLDDYRPVDGVMVAHSGRSVVTLFRFGEKAMSHTKTMMEEEWTIEEASFNVPGLTMDCFIPPADIRCDSTAGTREQLFQRGRRKSGTGHRAAKVAAAGKPKDKQDTIIWRVQL
ncbi:hypothetical protein Cni_G09283 [Canna indica]|uniref:Uncharacterized protein n=1 Tax=Canna indica TaxID=4628 RepID=A0AAQ3Q9G9_9LILI|nr:hypothetical protein Cni_G09283 [Canna indica]